ncbi:MAG: radical SAM family heme chaperone HemW [Candidatus Wallbacteria bacterium]|nr:radical SAM family heme chaperone HemW [Candidatus Wallbacteria bacterium]
MTAALGLYVHIPFCKAKCHYCDFASGPGTREQADGYLDLLEREAIRESGARRIDTVFVGGGTPSVLDGAQLTRLFRDVLGRFTLAPGAEVTLEANPESMDESKALLLAGLGVNRVSLGAQSFVPEELARLGRLHTADRVDTAVDAVRGAGIDNVNLDLICGFPGNSTETLDRSLDRLVALAPEHVSVYIYQLEQESHWGRIGIEPPDPDAQVELYYHAKDRLEASGYGHYEISNWCRPGRECRHNLKYWTGDPYLGIGLSAASFMDGRRLSNPDDFEAYAEAVESGPELESELSGDDLARELLMLRLRLLRGVDGLPGGLGGRATGEVLRALERYSRLGLLDRRGDGWALSRQGLALSNEVFADLI